MGVFKRSWQWFESRTGVSRFIGPIARHRVPEVGAKGWLFVFGSATLFAFIIQVVTGITLATGYVPASGNAYQSLDYITHQAPLGGWLRGMHFWGASAMVLLIGVHMLRVFLMASYKFPREMNWISGVILLFLTLAMGFTGQLLRWDQNAIWSVVVGAEQAGRTPLIGKVLAQFILGGSTLSAATLSRFFSFHVFFIPAVLFIVVGFHLYLVLRNGISTPPKRGQVVDPATYQQWYKRLIQEKGVPFWPDAAWRDLVFGGAVVATVAALALLIGPPALDKPPDPTIIQAHPRPDWYFIWYFSVLAIIPKAWEAWVIIGVPFLVGIGLILLPLVANKGERSPLRRPWAIATVLVIFCIVGALWYEGEVEPWYPRFDAQPLPQNVMASTSSAVQTGAKLFNEKGCEYCHMIDNYGGIRGPNLSHVASYLTTEQIKIRILNGAQNMPAYSTSLSADELNALVAFLESRQGSNVQPDSTPLPGSTPSPYPQPGQQAGGSR